MMKRLLVLGAIAGAVWLFVRRRGEREEETNPQPAGSGATEGGMAGSSPAGPASGPASPAHGVVASTTAAEAPAGAMQREREGGRAIQSTEPSRPQPPTPTAAAGPAGASALAAGQATGEPAPAAAESTQAPRRIKGNIHGGQKLYHLPEDETYGQVIEERLFATPEEAEAEGYRHARQPG